MSVKQGFEEFPMSRLKVGSSCKSIIFLLPSQIQTQNDPIFV